MVAIIGAAILGLVGLLLVGFNYSGVNMATWGMFGADNLFLYAGFIVLGTAAFAGVMGAFFGKGK